MLSSQLNQSKVSKSTVLIKRNKSAQMSFPQLPDIEKYDTNKLFEQFKRHLLKQDKKQLNKHTVIGNEYKNLLCDIKKNNQEKKGNLEKLSTKLKTINKLNTINSQNLFKDIKNQQKSQLDCNFDHITTEQTFKHSESKVNLSLCKFKPLRPMTSDNKFRITGNKSRMACFQFSQSRLVYQGLNVVSPNSKVTKFEEKLKTQNDGVSNLQTQQKYCQKSLAQISESTLMVEVQQSQLQEEISSLKQSLNKLTIQLQTVKKQLQIETRNEEKYKHISYLATSIKNQTDYIKLQNVKGYHTMMFRQDDTISQLKKFKTNLRKEKDDMETEYIDEINQWVQVQQDKNAAKKREFLFSGTNSPSKQNNDHKSPHKKFELISKPFSHSVKSNHSNSRNMKKLIDQLDGIVELLQANEMNFEQIKQRECTKVRLGKINKTLLPKQRVEVLERIEEFEQKYDMKIASIQNLIVSVYRKLFESNNSLESECVKMTQTKEELEKDLKEILQRHQSDIDEYESHYKFIESEQHQRRKLNQQMKKNSVIFLKIIQAFYTMLFKFRYMFSLALTLDIDKKSFRDCVIQIDSCFSSGVFFNFSYQKHLITSSQRHDIINQKEFKEILLDKSINSDLACELTEIMFNDHRINLILHKSWIENRFKYLFAGEIQEGDILDIIESVRIDCEQIYKMKLPSLASLFLTCFKSVSMSKYQSKLAASSSERGSIFLPTGPNKKFHYLQTVDQNNQSYEKDSQSSSYEVSKKKINFTTQNSTLREQNIFLKDPRKIIYHLEQIKNKNHKKFKALNFSCEGKSYKYNQQIVIPDFPMVSKCDDF